MSRRTKASILAFALVFTPSAWARAETPSAELATAPAYTLEVESDAPSVVSFEVLAPRIAADLGAPVVRPGAEPPSRAAITVRYREHELHVRAVHARERVLERSVKAEGDDEAVRHEAVLLAGNLARDEAKELLDALAARQPRPPAERPFAPPPASAEREPEETLPITAAFFYPLATNWGRPNVTSYVDLSLWYGRVGRIAGAQVGTTVVQASRAVSGAQVAGFGAIAGGPVDGAQVAGVFTLATGSTHGAQVAGGMNLATRDLVGAQVAPINIASSIEGAQLGVFNLGRHVRGAQVGVINVADRVDGAQVGVISLSRGGIHPIAWTSNLQYMNAGIKFSTRYAFTTGAVHYGTLEGSTDNVGVTVALGGRVPLPSSFDVELLASYTHLVPRPSQSRLRGNVWVAPQLSVGYAVASHLRFFVGGGARLPISVDIGRDVVRPEVLAGIQL